MLALIQSISSKIFIHQKEKIGHSTVEKSSRYKVKIISNNTYRHHVDMV